MEFQVSYRGQTVGQVDVAQTAHGVSWNAWCSLQTAEVLRLYGLRAGRPPLRIDVAEPAGGGLRVRRTMTWNAVEQMGYSRACLPDIYVLDGADGSGIDDACRTVTGDRRIDALIASGTVSCDPAGDGWRIGTRFSPGQACPLAFALTACSIREGCAVLNLPDQGSAPGNRQIKT